MNKLIITCALVCTSMALVGCSHQSNTSRIMTYITTDTAPVPTDDASTQQELTEAASSVSTSMQNLSAIQAAAHPYAKPAPPLNPSKVGMAQLISITWIGPVEPLLKKVCHGAGYRLRVHGTKPSMPIIVSVDVHSRPLAEVYRSIMYQAQSQARINLYPKKHLIELNYKN